MSNSDHFGLLHTDKSETVRPRVGEKHRAFIFTPPCFQRGFYFDNLYGKFLWPVMVHVTYMVPDLNMSKQAFTSFTTLSALQLVRAVPAVLLAVTYVEVLNTLAPVSAGPGAEQAAQGGPDSIGVRRGRFQNILQLSSFMGFVVC